MYPDWNQDEIDRTNAQRSLRDRQLARSEGQNDALAKLKRQQEYDAYRIEIRAKIAKAQREAEETGTGFVVPPPLPDQVPTWWNPEHEEGITRTQEVIGSVADLFGLEPSTKPLENTEGVRRIHKIPAHLGYGTTAKPTEDVGSVADVFGYAPPPTPEPSPEDQFRAAEVVSNVE